ncbi:hypothetical protein Tco_0171502, partial [Tanacetum coccineum]
YDNNYQGEELCDDQEDSLTTAMMLLARAITQRINVGNGGRNMRRTTDNQGDAVGNENVQRILRTTDNSRNASNVQCYNCNVKGRNGNGGEAATFHPQTRLANHAQNPPRL